MYVIRSIRWTCSWSQQARKGTRLRYGQEPFRAEMNGTLQTRKKHSASSLPRVSTPSLDPKSPNVVAQSISYVFASQCSSSFGVKNGWVAGGQRVRTLTIRVPHVGRPHQVKIANKKGTHLFCEYNTGIKRHPRCFSLRVHLDSPTATFSLLSLLSF
jgi:hypothetical protein